MIKESYQPARLVAPRVHSYFSRHLALARARGDELDTPIPDAAVIEELINAAFWASLRREEGYVPKISLAYLPPELDRYPLTLEHPLVLDPGVLTKVAPVVERAGIHLGVWHQNGELCVWGTTHTIPIFCFVLEVIEPGLLVVKHHRGEQSGKYVNVAVLEGDQMKVVDESASTLPDCPALLTSLLGFDSPSSWVGSVNILVQIAVSMRSHRRGGTLLIVPSSSDRWRESIVSPIHYAVLPPYRELADLMQKPADGKHPHVWQDELRETVDAIAGLTAVDGATLMSDDYQVLAFGAKITRRRGSAPIEQLTLTEPVEGGTPTIVPASQVGGTRHLSAAQFVNDQRDAVALVASQDGRFTLFAWSPCADTVHAHRVEALLL